MSQAKEDIEQLDAKMIKLKIEYEQYFARILKREPLKLREDVDRIVRRYSGMPINNTGIKFKYQTLVAKYNSYKQHWKRVLRRIEEGTYVRRAETSGPTLLQPKPPPVSSASTNGARPGAGNGDIDGDLKNVFDKFVATKKQCNESTSGISFDSMKKTLEAQKRKLATERGIKNVDLKVYVKDGKARIALTPKKG